MEEKEEGGERKLKKRVREVWKKGVTAGESKKEIKE